MRSKEWLQYIGLFVGILAVEIGLMCLVVYLAARIWLAVTR